MKRHEAFCTELDVVFDACCNWSSTAVSGFPLVVVDNNKQTSFIEANISCRNLTQGCRQRGGQWCPPPHLKYVPPHFMFGPRLLHTFNIVFKNVAHLVDLAPCYEILTMGLISLRLCDGPGREGIGRLPWR